MNSHLRPIERRILAMRSEGVSDAEIGRRLKKSPERVSLIAEWAELPGRRAVPRRTGLSPVQRRILTMRAGGQSHAEIGERLRRGPRYVRQMEGLAHFQQYQDLLG